MANTYSQIYVQIVFAVQGRMNLLPEKCREQVERYICGIISNSKSKALAIYCNPDHTHVLIGLHPTVSIADITREIKCNSSKWINENRMSLGKFSWQEGYGAFTYSKSQLDAVIKYVLNQPTHHKKKTFKEEYVEFLEKFGVEYDERYLFL